MVPILLAFFTVFLIALFLTVAGVRYFSERQRPPPGRLSAPNTENRENHDRRGFK